MLKFGSNSNGVQALNFIHKFRHLLLYSTSTSTSISADANPNFANYLVDFLGFQNQQALSTSNKHTRYRLIRGTKNVSDFKFVENADSVVQFLKHIGLDHSHIRKAVVRTPHILLCNVRKTLIPKTQAFLKLGFSSSDFTEIVELNPSILTTGLNKTVVPAVQALREIMGCDSDVIAVLRKTHGIRLHAISKNLVPNVALLRSFGIPIESIRKQLLKQTSVCTRKPELFQEVVIKVEEKLGIPRDSPQFLNGVHLLASVKEKTIHSKTEVFKSFGWAESDVALLLRKFPACFGLSTATIKKKLGFFMTKMGYQPEFFLTYSCLLTYSLEKRIVPRHKVILFLKEKSLISLEYGPHSAMVMTESRFLEKFVRPFKEVHEVYSKHAGLSMEVLTQRLLKK